MIATWPPALPRPEREGWELRAQDARRQTRSEAGPPTFRRRFSSAARLVRMTPPLDRAQPQLSDNVWGGATAGG